MSPGPNSRAVSYSFEKPDVVQKTSNPYINPSHQNNDNHLNQPVINRCRPIIKDQHQGRATSASSFFTQSVPDLVSIISPFFLIIYFRKKLNNENIFQPNNVPDLVRPMEYWKCPPPPFVPTYDPYLPPPRPPRPNLKKKLSDTSSRGRDSAIGPSPLQGKDLSAIN